MKKKVFNIIYVVLAVIMVVIQSLPVSVTYTRSVGPDESYTDITSYFDINDYGFLVPILICVLLSCILLAISILSLFFDQKALKITCFITAVISFVWNLLLAIECWNMLSIVGLVSTIIAFCYTTLFIILYIREKIAKKEQ